MQLAAVRLLWIAQCSFCRSRLNWTESRQFFVWDNVIRSRSSLPVPYGKLKMFIDMRTMCAVLVLVACGSTISQDIFELTTSLDDPRLRFLFHGFRNLVFNTIGQTGLKTKGRFLQEKFPDSAAFPCNVSLGRSKVRPHSIHKLRPGGNLFRPDTFQNPLCALLPDGCHLCVVFVCVPTKPVDYPFFISL